MSLLHRLFPTGLSTGRVTSGIKAYSETPGVLWADRHRSESGVIVDEEEALTLSAVFSACVRLASLQAMLPIGVYEKTDKGREEKPTNSVSNLLNVQMNPEQTAFTGRFFMDFWKPLFGAAVAEIGWDMAARAARIWPLGPWRVQVKEDDEGLYYWIDGKRRVHPDDMLYIPHITSDGVTGKGFVHYAIESLGTAIAADRTAGRFYENDMRPGGLLVHPNQSDKKTRDRLREEWKEAHAGKKRGSVGVLWGGWTWDKAAGAVDPDKAQLLESRQYSVLEVARWMNVPVHWLGDLTRSTWGNIEHQAIETLTQVVAPLLVAKEQEYDRKMLSPPRLYSKHNVNAILRGDMKTRGEFYRLMMEIGAYDVNKVLACEDENGIGPEGDVRFVPVNWQPLGDLMTGATAQKEINAAKPKPEPAGEKKSDKPKSKKPAAASVAGMMEHLLTMLSKKECNEANRAAKKPKDMMKWMDGFYGDFEKQMVNALAPVGSLTLELRSGPNRGYAPSGEAISVNWGAWAAEWCSASREQLLAAMDGPPEEWPNRMTDLLGRWQTRPGESAMAWTQPLLMKEMQDAQE